MPTNIKVGGDAELKRIITSFARRFPVQAEAALRQECEIEMAEAKNRTPVDTGALRASGRVETERTSNYVRATLSFGGASAPYALKVHEDLDAYHDDGQAKYLESVLQESAPFMAARVARRLQVEKI